MERVAPAGPVYQAGTLSGNPLAMAAGYETLHILNEEAGLYVRLETTSRQLEEELLEPIRLSGLPVGVNRVGSMLTLFFSGEPVTNYESALRCDTKRFGLYFRSMLDRGIYLPPSQFEAAFLSAAHSQEDIDRTIAAHTQALRAAFS